MSDKNGGKLYFLILGSRRGKDAARFYPVTKDPRSQVNLIEHLEDGVDKPDILYNSSNIELSVFYELVSLFVCPP